MHVRDGTIIKEIKGMNKFTKIVATISDRRCDVEFLRELYAHGMNVVRVNSAHLQLDGFKKIIENVRAVSSTIGILWMQKAGDTLLPPTNRMLKSSFVLATGVVFPR